jgi:Xaa-Pro aminopeptidase
MSEHIQRLQKNLKKGEAVLLFNGGSVDPHMQHIISCDMEYAFLLVTKKKNVLFVSVLEVERAQKTLSVGKVVELSSGLKDLTPFLKSVSVLYLNYGHISVAAFRKVKKSFKGLKFKDGGDIFMKLRILKTSSEVAIIKKACLITARIWKELLGNWKKFKTELDVAQFIRFKALEYANGVSFDPIVASGRNGALPHYVPQKRKLVKGFCVIDFGVRLNGYISDVTRTVYLGKPSGAEIGDYNKVLSSNIRSISALKKGIAFKKVDAVSRRDFDYCHSLGHGIGVEVHEAPALAKRSKSKLVAGMCFTIEPGMYLSGKYGIRIEDDIYFDGKKVHVLTQGISKKLTLV